MSDLEISAAIRDELESMRARFHALLASWTEADFNRQSLNLGWTNGEVLAHMTFGLVIVDVLLPITRLGGRLPPGYSKAFAATLNFFTGLFNWINAFGARMQGRVLTRARIEGLYDRVHYRLLRKIAALDADEWGRGMYYPAQWDPNFRAYMTLEDVFRYAILHFNFHWQQLDFSGETEADQANHQV